MDILKQLNDAIIYIESNLCSNINIDKAAEMACATEDSFTRFFSYMTGMTLKEYIRRRRLTLAGYELRKGTAKIVDIAVKYGYTSADAIAKAFQKQHGISPSCARNKQYSLKIYPPAAFYLTIKGAKEMDFRIIETEKEEIYGVSKCFGGQASERFELEHRMWSEEDNFVPAEICEGYDGLWYGIWQQGQYMIGRKKKDIQAPNLEKKIISADTYAAFTTQCGVFAGDAFPKLRELIFHSWLPDSGYRQTSDTEIEVYHLWTDRKERRKKRFFEIWIPVQPI